jgi:hypothetical protein
MHGATLKKKQNRFILYSHNRQLFRSVQYVKTLYHKTFLNIKSGASVAPVSQLRTSYMFLLQTVENSKYLHRWQSAQRQNKVISLVQ